MINPIYPKLLDRLRRLEVEISIPCRHGWRWAHCNRDDEGSHARALLETDSCYCGEARHIVLPLVLLRLADRLRRSREAAAALPRARR